MARASHHPTESPVSCRCCWGSAGPLTAPFLAVGLTRAAYIGTEAVSALTRHLAKSTPHGPGNRFTGTIQLYGTTLTPATRL